jgi:hypothetical protein
MTQVFRCDYCGTYQPLSRATIIWCWVDDLGNEDEVYTSGIYCSPYCGERVRTGASIVGGR